MPKLGTCRLCRLEKPLLKSHFLPRALYPKSGGMEYRARNGSGLSAAQMKQYLLCKDCEERFDQGGETEVLLQIAAKNIKRFPLHEKLRLALPLRSGKNVLEFEGDRLGLDMEKFSYFALSLLWRGVVAQWLMPCGALTSPLQIGDFEEPIRKYLLGEASYPAQTWVIVIVEANEIARAAFTVPQGVSKSGFPDFGFLVRGVHFRVAMGPNVPMYLQQCCCTLPQRYIFYGSDEQALLASLAPLAPMV